MPLILPSRLLRNGRRLSRRVAAVASDQACVRAACIRSCVGCHLIIPMIIQTIGLDPSGVIWTDGASNVSRLDPSGAV